MDVHGCCCLAIQVAENIAKHSHVNIWLHCRLLMSDPMYEVSLWSVMIYQWQCNFRHPPHTLDRDVLATLLTEEYLNFLNIQHIHVVVGIYVWLDWDLLISLDLAGQLILNFWARFQVTYLLINREAYNTLFNDVHIGDLSIGLEARLAMVGSTGTNSM